MFKKPMTYNLHILMIVVCLIAILTLKIIFWGPICLIGVLIHTHLKRSCLGLYYGDAEKLSVEIVEVGPKVIKG